MNDGIRSREVRVIGPDSENFGVMLTKDALLKATELGLDLIEIPPEPAGDLPQKVLAEVPPVYHLMSGLSPRGFGHRCVGFGGQVLWDPHPSRAGLTSVWSVGFLVPRC